MISLYMINHLILPIVLMISQILTFANNVWLKIAFNVKIVEAHHVTLANKGIL